jgi:DNA primase
MLERERVNRVLKQTSAVGLIGEYTRLTRCGDRWMGTCPLHGNEDVYSLFVDDRKGLYFCFGCESQGNVIRFLQHVEGLSIEQAVARLEHRMNYW